MESLRLIVMLLLFIGGADKSAGRLWCACHADEQRGEGEGTHKPNAMVQHGHQGQWAFEKWSQGQATLVFAATEEWKEGRSGEELSLKRH